jgi:formylglycine-generating enzyme required for sulfatase activity
MEKGMIEIKLNDDFSINMVQIPEGTFIIGSPESDITHKSWECPQTEINLKSFMMSQTLITREQWDIVAKFPKIQFELDTCPHPTNVFISQGVNMPVTGISWLSAIEFCNRLSAYCGYNVTLPTESQWEYACRAGTTTKYYFGDKYSDSQCNIHSFGVTPVKTFPPNRWGLYDMYGNVFEWCLDHWHDDYIGIPTDGSARLNGNPLLRVTRGSCWGSTKYNTKSSARCFGHVSQELADVLSIIDLYQFRLNQHPPLFNIERSEYANCIFGLRICISL